MKLLLTKQGQDRGEAPVVQRVTEGCGQQGGRSKNERKESTWAKDSFSSSTTS